jgi:hypothetical protein
MQEQVEKIETRGTRRPIIAPAYDPRLGQFVLAEDGIRALPRWTAAWRRDPQAAQKALWGTGAGVSPLCALYV